MEHFIKGNRQKHHVLENNAQLLRLGLPWEERNPLIQLAYDAPDSPDVDGSVVAAL